MKLITKICTGLALVSGIYTTANAVPILQIGAPAGPGDSGTYADYIGTSTDPTEEDTAFTYGNTIFVGGVYKNDRIFNLGAQFGSGEDWSGVDAAYSPFDGFGAMLLAAVPEGTLASALANLTVNGSPAIYSTTTLADLFPNNHDPLKDVVSDFLFFSIGDFSRNIGAVPDFDPETGAADGEIKSLTIVGTQGLDWIHFDALALATGLQGQTNVSTTIENNPGSHDLTWKPGGITLTAVPEPGTLALLSIGLAGFGFVKRCRRNA